MVTDYLTGHGFAVLDADEVAHAVTQPGEPAWRAIRDAFGDGVLAKDATLDRAFVAEVVFHDPTALKRLNLITHGQIAREILRRIDLVRAPVVFLALPLFRREHREAFSLDEVWAVLASPDVALSRLVERRGFTRTDAEARLASQISNEERAKLVERVLWNDGTLEELYAKLDHELDRCGLVRG